MEERINQSSSRKEALDGGEIAEVVNKLRGLEKQQQIILQMESEIQQQQMKRDLLKESIEELGRSIDLYEGSIISHLTRKQ
jgi:hypothetical protein